MEVKVFFFGVLAEVTGTGFKHYRDMKSISDLKLRIQDEFPEIVHYNFRISLNNEITDKDLFCLLYTSPSPRDGLLSRMPSSA